MKLFIDHAIDQSGKGKFISRLIPALKKINVTIVDSPDDCDIALGLTKWKNDRLKRKPKVLRVDGVHILDNEKSRWRNGLVRKSIKQSDAVVFQSEFAYKMVTGILNVKPKSVIIFNGANPEDYQKTEALDLFYKYNILMSAKWWSRDERPSKRLGQMLNVANEYTKHHSDVCFWVAGPFKCDPPKNVRIKMLGNLDELELRKYIKSCDMLLYMARYDWCPNAVVECLAGGLPVVCSNGTGVEELVRATNGGVVLDLDTDLSNAYHKKIQYKLDTVPVMEAIDSMRANPIRPETIYVNINTIAEQYKNIFEDVLDGSI